MAMARICAQCGISNDATKAFCAQCGATLGAAPAHTPAVEPGGAARVAASKTVLGMSSRDLMPPPNANAAPAPASPQAPPSNPASQAHVGVGAGAIAGAANRTVLGMPAIGGLVASAGPSSTAGGGGGGLPGGAQKTMLGVAIPGIAPLSPGSTAPTAPGSTAPVSGARVPVQNENRTMLGVPAVGAAPPPQPLTTGMFPVAPAPPPLELEPLPAPPRIVKRKGVPIALVLGGLLALLIGLGGVGILLSKAASPLVVHPRLSAKGTDVLHVTCDTCPDGTFVSVAAAVGTAAEFKNKEADLDLAAPLVIGENAFTLKLDRPGMSRDEEVKARVPVEYRIRTDFSAIGDPAPALKIVVEAAPGATVILDGKPFPLDAKGKGVLPIDLTAECTGMADETRTIEKNIPYEVTIKNRTEKGSVAARVGVPALRVDAPLRHTVIGSDRFYVAGRTVKGAAITVNGRPVTVDATGMFAEPFGAPTSADIAIEVRASMLSAASRTVTLKLRKSEALEAQARSAEKAQTAPGSYADLLANVAPSVGKTRAIEGDLVEVRQTNRQSVMLVRDKRNCDRADGCMFRVLHGAELDAKPGRKVLVVGRVTRTLTAGGSTVPEIEAEFVVPLAGSARK